MRSRESAIIATCVIAAFSIQLLAATPSSPSKQFAISDAVQGWNDLETIYSHTQGSGVRRQKSKSRNETITAKARFVNKGQLHLVAEHGVRTGAELALCRGAKESFTLRRDSNDRDYLVRSLEDNASDSATTKRLSLAIGQFTQAPFSIGGLLLKDLVARPEFKLLNTSRSTDPDGRQLIAVSFDYTPPNPKLSVSLKNAKLVLWPENHYSVVEYSSLTNKGAISGSVEYNAEVAVDSDKPERVHFPIKVTHKLWRNRPDEGVPGTVSSFEFEEFSPYVASDDEFTLSAFGVKELRDIHRVKGWFILANIAAVVLVVLLLLRKRGVFPRRERHIASKDPSSA